MRQTDLFSEFGFSENESERPDPNLVRDKLVAMLREVREAQQMPWPSKTARVNEIVFPQMANWLPKDEAEQLCFEFAQEIERLKLAA
jgi:hypothetical protein